LDLHGNRCFTPGGASVTDPYPVAGRTTDLTPFVRSAQAGDDEAFRVLYRAVQPGLLRYLGALVGADAEDVASETWLQIARDLPRFPGRDGFRAWAAKIGRNRAIDHLRHRGRRPAVNMPVEYLVEVPDQGDAGEEATEMISTDAALALIRTLPRDQAEAVLLRVVVGLDAAAAGKVLGKRAGAVRTAAYRGLRTLAERLDGGPAPAAAGTRRSAPATRTGPTWTR
jgi:RNA polymerase sigma-70 factor (ECF subfamily)